jgi:hypothetical protein
MMNNKFWLILTAILSVALIILLATINLNFLRMKNMENVRSDFISLKNSIQQQMKMQHNYRCCLEKPCTYCIEKTPGHGEGAACDCLSDLVNGVHPCGECIGEILEGHGNPYLAEYFATAIAEEIGEQHLNTLKQIISEKYEISIEEQV